MWRANVNSSYSSSDGRFIPSYANDFGTEDFAKQAAERFIGEYRVCSNN